MPNNSKNRNVVVITHRFPFDGIKDFFADEFQYCLRSFNDVTILSLSKSGNISERIPERCKVIRIREQHKSVRDFFRTAINMFSMSTVKEVFFAFSKWRERNLIYILRMIFIYKYYERKIAKIIKELDFSPSNTLFYSYWMGYEAFALASLKSKGLIRYAVTRTHGYDCFFDRGYQPFRRTILQHMDYVFPISDAGKLDLIEKQIKFVKIPHAEISVARLGIEDPSSINVAMATFVGNLRIVSCSRVTKIKRLDILVKALSLLRIPYYWIHFGDGEDYISIKEMASALLPKSKDHNWEMPGFTENHDVLEHYKNYPVDVFVNCSDHEGIPVSIMEAMSFGIPVIARNVGGVSEIVDDRNGVLLSDGNPSSLANALELVASLSKEKLEHLRSCSRSVFLEKYSSSHNYEFFYKKILEIMK